MGGRFAMGTGGIEHQVATTMTMERQWVKNSSKSDSGRFRIFSRAGAIAGGTAMEKGAPIIDSGCSVRVSCGVKSLQKCANA